ncbi:MAG: Rhs protein-like protein [Ramlibacter sp.]|nr:Rhs protein-like protein [Ramlibacter sp.]
MAVNKVIQMKFNFGNLSGLERAAQWLARTLCLAALLGAAGIAQAQQATGTSLSSSSSSTSYGQTITLTATVIRTDTSASVGTVGSVTFKDGSTAIGTGAVTSGTATLVTNKLAAGSHSLTAVYGANATFGTSTSSAITQTVSVSSSTTTLIVTPNPASLGQNVTLVAHIAGLSPGGSVTFSDSSTVLGSVTVNAGAASVSLTSLTQGSHSLSAVYSGDANLATSTSSAVSATVAIRADYTWQYGYDAMGRINTMVDPNGQATYVYYDSLGRPIQSQQPPNTGSGTPTVTQLGWNLNDSVTSVIDPRVLTTTYSVNGLRNATAQSSPDTNTSTFTYDAKGNVLTSIDARGKTTTFAWDSIDRLKTLTFATGSPIAFEYDGGASPTAAEKGELTKMSDESGQTTYAHDSMGRLGTKTVVIGSKTFTVSYGWGNSGAAMDKLTAITYPSGSRVNYTYDSQGAVSGITVNAVNANGVGFSGSATTVLGSVTYNAENKVTGWLWSDGKARTISYDSGGNIASYTLGDPTGTGNKAGVVRTVLRDAAGRITGYTHTNSGSAVTSLDQSFGYDNLDRLLTATVNGASTGYSYDDTGNRTAKTVGGSTYTTTVAISSNRLTQVQDVGGTATIQYDSAGHVTSDGSNTFAYSDRGRMVTASNAGGTVTYVYNGLEQRAGKSGAATAYFVYDEGGQLLGEYDATGAPVYETIYLGSMPAGAIKQTGTAGGSNIAVTLHNVSADHIDTARLITKQDQTIVWRWDSAEAFGGTAPDQNPNSLGTFTFNQRFPGQVFDSETGLFQNWNREYNARLGRYVQPDPIGLAGGPNLYLYADATPLSKADPKGLTAASSSANMSVPAPGTNSGADQCVADWRGDRRACYQMCQALGRAMGGASGQAFIETCVLRCNLNHIRPGG